MTKPMALPSQKRLRELFDYSPDNGLLTWKTRPEVPKDWNVKYAGKIAGGEGRKGYISVGIDGKKYMVHRIIWAFMTGDELFDEIDHIDGDPLNNRFANLRAVSHTENMRNMSHQKRSKSGTNGVCLEHGKHWTARINVNGRSMKLGRFSRVEDAIAARKAAEARLGYHPNHGRASQASEERKS